MSVFSQIYQTIRDVRYKINGGDLICASCISIFHVHEICSYHKILFGRHMVVAPGSTNLYSKPRIFIRITSDHVRHHSSSTRRERGRASPMAVVSLSARTEVSCESCPRQASQDFSSECVCYHSHVAHPHQSGTATLHAPVLPNLRP